MHVQQSSLVCCNNDVLACSISRLPNYFKCLWNCDVMCLVVPTAACLLISGSLGVIIIAHWPHWSPDYKMWFHSISMHTLRCQHQRLLEIGDIFLNFWSNRNFCSMNSLLKELYWISEAPIDVLKFELWFTLEDLHFPREQWFFLHYRVMLHDQFMWPLCKKKCSVGFSMMLQSYRWQRTRFVKVLTASELH